MKKIMDGNEACSYVSYNFTEVAGIYPITPASPMAEVTDKWSSEGKLNYFGTPVKVVEMESEAGAAGMVHGSLQAGCLTTTYTASQGLLLMIPNMYKIAGELLPCVINVAARSLATHALSIFGDHQDIYATRSTGFAMLASSSVQQVMDLTGVAHLSAIKGRVPFINFFDGFRTSHELQKVEVIDTDKLKNLIDERALNEFRERALGSDNPVIKGTAQNEDIYFQATEVRNEYYNKLPDIVSKYMEEINKITGKDYQPFNYYGSKTANKVIVAMGSVCETIKETIDYLIEEKNENVGLLEVHLYRPFSSKYFLKALPKSVKKIAVLDRTKEAGSAGEPLYLDVVKTIKEIDAKVSVYGGRYGLSSKNTTPAMIKGLYDFLDTREVHNNFTLGIVDDVTNLSVKYDKTFRIPSNNIEFLIYGFGSDGMVSASKDIMKITGTYTNAYVQGYFQYDSKKSGGVTISNLRFGKRPIRSTYYVEKASLIVCTKDSYLKRLKMLEKIKNKGVFVLNTTKTPDEVLASMSVHDKKILQDRNIKMFIINATKMAEDAGIPGKISAIMESLIFKLGKIIDFNFALGKIKENLAVKFANKGGDLVTKNIKAIEASLDGLVPVKVPYVDYVESFDKQKNFFETIDSMEGDSLPVSSFIKRPDGSFEAGTSKLDKRDSSDMAPSYNSNNCISCNLCSLVCPHGVIRPFLLNEKEQIDAPESVNRNLIPASIKDKDYKFTVGVSLPDCTGCSLCSEVCPGKKGAKALVMKMKDALLEDKKDEEYQYLFNEVSEKKDVMPTNTVKGSQFKKPRFEFPGACAGCGETPYLKLLTQLFGDKLIISNATGCSSIYGASTPSMPYSVPWANSLFEDNAEFGFGMRIADMAMKNRIVSLIKNNIKDVKKSELDIYKAYAKDINDNTAKDLLEVVDNSKITDLVKLKRFISPKSIWLVGGDGWAYDIGYNGIDHVLANKENINILVLDTEVYSNTGGQSSKSTRTGAVAKFASSGKETAKKDLAKMALTYDHVYVGTISLGANPNQAIKVLKEADEYNGPSIVIAYAPCIAQGIIKGMKNSISEEKGATESGYFPLFHYNPANLEFKMDSKADFSKYEEFILGEDRYRSLKNLNKNAKELLDKNKKNAMKRYQYYEKLSKNEE
ncbi:MAG: pyruvate:ferredoxin (flavodoxin) oxidoreductase [Bacilli bacterium]|nr:pyruvate:ferredoxin (flavodoxin) oxidoreductase [bacterium]MDY2696958.1 pyruvate:ferredoxin (flavodoxin) oxidoreductase [Bacilli bacterium]